ncbi:MAG: hypothetical protein ACTSUE_22135 [Promethearchaeota archaeon]
MSRDEFKVLAKKHNSLCTFFQVLTIILGIFAIATSMYTQLLVSQPLHGVAYGIIAVIVTILLCFILQKIKYKPA